MSTPAPLPQPPLTWLEPGQDFPPLTLAWGEDSPAPGLLAAGGALDVTTLCQAYSQGIFPWFSPGQPILWWAPHPRMVLDVARFRVHRSFKKNLFQFQRSPDCEIRFDSAFEQVIRACAQGQRPGQRGTWIVPDMVDAYVALHQAGFAHSVETWVKGELVGGLYCVALGKAVFGESMFSRQANASKIALAALVSWCRHNDVPSIDCQQNTEHLARLGAREMPRQNFLEQVRYNLHLSTPSWLFDPLYWQSLMPPDC